jgi:cytidylate kinase
MMATAERQMQAWARMQEIAERKARAGCAEAISRRAKEHITISREAGAGGSEIAELVGQKLGWEVLDKALIDRVANRYRLSRPVLEAVDETSASFAYDTLWSWLDPQVVSHEKYLTRLSRVLSAAAQRNHLIVVGRGGQFILPRQQVLAVRLVASEKYRVNRLMKANQLDAARARRLMEDLERGRRAFVQHFFHHDITDPHLYDLVINVDSFGPECTAELIICALRVGRVMRQERRLRAKDSGTAEEPPAALGDTGALH